MKEKKRDLKSPQKAKTITQEDKLEKTLEVSSTATSSAGDKNSTTHHDDIQEVSVEVEDCEANLTRVTLEADRFAVNYLSLLLAPLIIVLALRSLIYEKHISWYVIEYHVIIDTVFIYDILFMKCKQYLHCYVAVLLLLLLLA